MKKFVLLYRGGNAPDDKGQEVMEEWGQFVGELMKRGVQKAGLPFAGGKVISSDGVEDYKSSDGDVAGFSEIEVESIDEAVKAAQMAPNLKYGGTVEIREAMDMPEMDM